MCKRWHRATDAWLCGGGSATTILNHRSLRKLDDKGTRCTSASRVCCQQHPGLCLSRTVTARSQSLGAVPLPAHFQEALGPERLGVGPVLLAVVHGVDRQQRRRACATGTPVQHGMKAGDTAKPQGHRGHTKAGPGGPDPEAGAPTPAQTYNKQQHLKEMQPGGPAGHARRSATTVPWLPSSYQQAIESRRGAKIPHCLQPTHIRRCACCRW